MDTGLILRTASTGTLPHAATTAAATVGSTEDARNNRLKDISDGVPRKVPQRSNAKRGHFVG